MEIVLFQIKPSAKTSKLKSEWCLILTYVISVKMNVSDTQVALPIVLWVLWKQTLKEELLGSLYETWSQEKKNLSI